MLSTSRPRWTSRVPPALLALAAFAGCGFLPVPSDPSKRSTGPYLQVDASDSVVVSWFTPEPQTGSLEVIDAQTGTVVATFSENQPIKHHAIRVSALPVRTPYLYRLIGPAATDTDTHELRTPAAPGTPLRFAVVGDSGSGFASEYAVTARIAADRPDYILHVGDIVYPAGADANYDSAFFRPFAAILDRTPLLPCIGNHDVDTLDGQAYLENFILPRNGPAGLEERCYSVVLGDVHLISIDSTRDAQLISETIVAWMRDTLSHSTTQWRVLILHHPIYHSGSAKHPNVAENINFWEPLCDDMHIDLCLTGHNHFYERSVPLLADAQAPPGTGTVYVVSGNGGQFLYPINPPAWFSAAHNDQTHGFVRLDFSGATLELSEIDLNGRPLDATSWTKAPLQPY